MNAEDLSALDRTTLRVWRISNLVGWGVLGTVAGVATFVLSARTVVGVLAGLLGGTVGFLVPYAGCMAVGAVVDGAIIGDHVYRSPGWVAAAGILAPGALMVLLSPVGSPVEAAFVLATPALGALVAALVARGRFRRRPRALRAPRA
jgi:hypothetical protein